MKEAEKKRKRLKHLQQSSAAGTGGYEQLRGEQWNDALKAASGEKTLIVGSNSIEGSEGKIKKALKKREKRKARSAEQWSERIAATEDDERSKQMVREHNLKKRILKKKGVDIDDVAATAAHGAGGGVEGGLGSTNKQQQPPAKRPRLFMVHKYRETDEKNGTGGGHGGDNAVERGRDSKANSYSKGGSTESKGQRHHSKSSSSGGGGGRDGKDRDSRGNHFKGGEKGQYRGGNNNNYQGNNNNRAGFEGKKRNGEYLNK